ncbi:dicarboxylate/amino acid:cation symporter [Marinilongibacter aquaticus]|uniref:dicarboxylate/amino acid:cation symporter n=1 Tax=Marinilongibacter aquaticus TaxID=2975157 RepID=UPI0021BD44D6|nr:dicarboxylate/amino acid:cation symporter [Marinilongibacter aquaticus]UBM59310.1 dicarboxylate/amino acid:cation symporter [Marinilongibacter aquaticus]
MRKLALHWKIILGMILGILFGILLNQFEGGAQFESDWIKPFGTIFINSLKLIAVPLIIASLIKGVSDLNDIRQLSKMGTRTIGLYILTTVISISVGLLLVNIINPGGFIEESTREGMMAGFANQAGSTIEAADKTKGAGPLQALVDVIPDNIVAAASSNGNMLQVIFFVVFFGIGLILIEEEKSAPVKSFFDGLNEVILKMIDIIMLFAPYGVFSLMATLVVEAPSTDVFVALGAYALTVVLGLALMLFVFYPSVVKMFTGIGFKKFLNGISPAQLLAFSTSSSAATLPVTMERVEEHLGVQKDVVSFVCPVGATINMDGTSLYQGVAAVFIAQVFGNDLTLMDQLAIVLTATLASIGTAAVPGAGVLMLVIVLESIGVNPAGIALIFAIDRPLDMIRTSVNITSDSTVAMLVAKSLGKLHEPHVKNWDDHYKKETKE